MALSGNKGEWSEIYVLLKLLAEKQLKIGDENLNAVEGLIYPIIRVIRLEATDNRVEFSYDDNMVVIANGEQVRIPIDTFLHNANLLFKKIRQTQSVFEYSELEVFLNSIKVNSLKASSRDKTDITIQIHDINSTFEPVLGFSIKSQLGRPSTLVNASGATNFLYKIEGPDLSQETIDLFNDTASFSRRFALLESYGNTVKFITATNRIFASNLTAIDSQFAHMLGEMLLYYYSSNNADNSIKSYTQQVAVSNPLKFDIETNDTLYEMKMKEFLTKYALGMQAARVWRGQYDATGGYIIVKPDGDIVCYHFFYVNQFENYLLANTKFDTPSTSRHDFGYIFRDNNEYYIKLNLQIRFIQ